MALARAQEERGADIVKIVNYSDTPEDDSSSLWLIERLKREISRPVLYLTRGDCCDLVRRIGAIHGSAMYLCVDRYLPVTAKAQPLLRSARAIRDNILF